MTDVVGHIMQWGNSLGVRLPVAVAQAAHWRVGQRVRVSVKGDQGVITPATDVYLSLEERLAVYDPTCHGGEVMMGTIEHVGADRW